MTEKEQAAHAARLRLVSAESSQTPGSRIDVRITLGLRAPGDEPDEPERLYSGRAGGVGADILEPRLAVEATLAAIADATGNAERFRLVGLKVVPAFDTRVVLVCLRSAEPPVQLVGAVASRTHGDIAQTAARATLSATNRVLVRSPNKTASETVPKTSDPVPER